MVSLMQPLVGHVCTFSFFQDPESVALQCPLVHHIMRLDHSRVKRHGQYSVSIIRLAESSGLSFLEISHVIGTMQQMHHA